MAARPVPITVPQMGTVQAVLVVEWLVPNGEQVEAGQPVVVVDTDKAVTELPAPASGILEIFVQAGDEEVAVGSVLGQVVSG